MFNLNEIVIDSSIVHHIGSKFEEEGIRFSENTLEFNDENTMLYLLSYFIRPFKPGEYYQLGTGENPDQNEVYASVKRIFEDPDTLAEESVNLANHLYDQSTHPKIKSGELYVVLFSNCIFDGEVTRAVGLFKSETKETFLKVTAKGGKTDLECEDGININKLDKGCLIFEVEPDEGYILSIVDNVNKGSDAQYWRDHFLGVRPRKDEYHQTRNYLDMCKTFVLEQVPKEFEVSKADQADFLNKSADYFKKNEEFAFNEFTEQVIKQPEVMESFRQYKKQYETENACEIDDEFVISAPAVKKEAKVFKSVIKLDKNFHIYVHGNREYIVKGFDEKTGMNYYQIFFKDES